MKKIIIFQVLMIILVSCGKRENVHVDILLLNQLLENSYNYFFLSTLGRSDSASYKKDVIKLKALSDQAIHSLNARNFNIDIFNEFYQHATSILQKHEFDGGLDLSSVYISSEKRNLEVRIKLLEYIAVNTAIKDFHSSFFLFDVSTIIVVPESQVVQNGEIYRANIYLAVDNSANPIKLIVDNDTIEKRSGGGMSYEYHTEKVGMHSKEAGLQINHRGEKMVVPFFINFEVR